MRQIFLLTSLLVLITSGVYGQERLARKNYDKAADAARDGDFAKAEKLYRAALENLPAGADKNLRARINFNIGACLYRTGQASEAIPFYEKALEISGGEYARVFYALGMAFTEKGEFAKAAGAFEKYLRMMPKDGEAWFDMGLAAWNQGDFPSAKKAFERALSCGVSSPSDTLNNIGVVMAMQGNMPGAIEKFEEALGESGGENLEASANLKICKRGESVAKLELNRSAGQNHLR